MSSLRNLRALGIVVGSLTALGGAQAAVYGGVEFPQGLSSFADAVVSYDPVIKSGQPTAVHQNFADTVGPPNYTGQPSQYASLGDGGSITLEFIDNRLTGSGDDKKDLWIFEVGPDVEDTFVEISKNGTDWTPVGKVFGSTAGIDIDFYGFGPADQFRFLRLTDDPNEGDQSGASVGADIDAVGAIFSVSAPIPEPQTYLLMLSGLGLVCAIARRRKT